MSFRSFILYCTVAGGWAAFLGWALGRIMIGPRTPVGAEVAVAGIKAMFLGMFVGLILSLLDAIWNFSLRQVGRVMPRVAVGVTIGTVGGLLGGMIGQFFAGRFQASAAILLYVVFVILGWAITGTLVGTSMGAFDLLARFVMGQDVTGAWKKITRGLIGGCLGGLLGGLLLLGLRSLWGRVFQDRPADELLSPSATGFVVLGLCIGLMVGLAQVIFREAWLRVDVGFRAGRELILTKPVTTIGRAESCDVGLFGDSNVDRLHARIIQENGRYLLVDAGSRNGTLVNDLPVIEPKRLRSGDTIQLGNSRLCFMEKERRSE